MHVCDCTRLSPYLGACCLELVLAQPRRLSQASLSDDGLLALPLCRLLCCFFCKLGPRLTHARQLATFVLQAPTLRESLRMQLRQSCRGSVTSLTALVRHDPVDLTAALLLCRLFCCLAYKLRLRLAHACQLVELGFLCLHPQL